MCRVAAEAGGKGGASKGKSAPRSPKPAFINALLPDEAPLEANALTGDTLPEYSFNQASDVCPDFNSNCPADSDSNRVYGVICDFPQADPAYHTGMNFICGGVPPMGLWWVAGH